MANLGYLPGGDPGVITRAEDAPAMLDAALANSVRPGGVISILAYPGHPGGDIESDVAVDVRLGTRADEGFSMSNAMATPEDPRANRGWPC